MNDLKFIAIVILIILLTLEVFLKSNIIDSRNEEIKSLTNTIEYYEDFYTESEQEEEVVKKKEKEFKKFYNKGFSFCMPANRANYFRLDLRDKVTYKKDDFTSIAFVNPIDNEIHIQYFDMCRFLIDNKDLLKKYATKRKDLGLETQKHYLSYEYI